MVYAQRYSHNKQGIDRRSLAWGRECMPQPDSDTEQLTRRSIMRKSAALGSSAVIGSVAVGSASAFDENPDENNIPEWKEDEYSQCMYSRSCAGYDGEYPLRFVEKKDLKGLCEKSSTLQLAAASQGCTVWTGLASMGYGPAGPVAVMIGCGVVIGACYLKKSLSQEYDREIETVKVYDVTESKGRVSAGDIAVEPVWNDDGWWIF